MRELVVARFNESLDWLDFFPYDLSAPLFVTVYNKGEPIIHKSGYAVKKVRNFGREAHTYLLHIVYKWESLADWMVFCQGEPRSHTRIIDLSRLVFSNPDALGYDGLNLVTFDQLTPLSDKDLETHGARRVRQSSIDLYHKVLNGRTPTHYWSGAIFGVSSQKIRGYPLQTYKDLLETVSNHRHPEEAHYLEGIWRELFKGAS